MANALTRLWFNGMNRLVRAQRRQTTRVVKQLLTPPKLKERRAAAKPVLRKSSLVLRPPPVVRRAPAPTVARRPTFSSALTPTRAAPSPSPSPSPKVRGAGSRTTGKRKTSSLPAVPTTQGRFTRHVFKSAVGSPAGNRSSLHYWLYRPSNAPASPRPLVVMLHGCGQTALEFAQGTRMNELAEKKGFMVLYPQQSVSREASRCWPWYTRQTQRGEGDAELITELLQSVLEQHRINRRRIYVCGISAGAAMAQILGLTNPELFAAVGMHSGPVFGTADSAARGFSVMQNGDAVRFARPVREILAAAPRPIELPALLIHGDQDKVVRPVNLMQVARQFLLFIGIDERSVAPELHEQLARPRAAWPAHAWRTLSYLQDGRPLVVACQISGLDHAWSGGARGLRYNCETGPDASQMFWTFFARHRSTSQQPAALERAAVGMAELAA